MPIEVKSTCTRPLMSVDKGQLKARLTPIEYMVTQEKHTEQPFSNKFYKHNEPGTYSCKVCFEDLFDSDTKYHSGSGWPAFYDVLHKDKVIYKPDTSGIGGNLLLIASKPHLIRTEVNCRNCGSHLGHVFQDGPKPTGLRYCINSCSLDFRSKPKETAEEEECREEAPGDGHCSQTSEETTSTKPLMFHPATLGGCDGLDGVCSRNAQRIASKLRTDSSSSSSAK